MWTDVEYLSNSGKTIIVYLCTRASGQDKCESKSVWACESESEGGVKKKEVLEPFKNYFYS